MIPLNIKHITIALLTGIAIGAFIPSAIISGEHNRYKGITHVD
jgi:uncharacterized protein YneF (UPF0154 family)